MGLRAKDVAERLGWSGAYQSLLEQGVMDVNAATARKLVGLVGPDIFL